MSLNRVVLVGRIGRDPEIKFTPSGKTVASFSVAVSRFTKDEAGNYETDWFNVTAWGKTAEFIQNYLGKGREVSIDGRLQTRSWEDKATGMKRSAVDIVAEHVNPVGPRPKEDGEDSDGAAAEGETKRPARPAAAPTPGQPQRPAAASSYQATGDEDEADPFAED